MLPMQKHTLPYCQYFIVILGMKTLIFFSLGTRLDFFRQTLAYVELYRPGKKMNTLYHYQLRRFKSLLSGLIFAYAHLWYPTRDITTRSLWIFLWKILGSCQKNGYEDLAMATQMGGRKMLCESHLGVSIPFKNITNGRYYGVRDLLSRWCWKKVSFAPFRFRWNCH